MRLMLYFCVNENVDQIKLLQLCLRRSNKEPAIEMCKLYLSAKENMERIYWFSDHPVTRQFIEPNLLFHTAKRCVKLTKFSDKSKI
jgi:hypothetical protein